jgi:UDP-N-acetylmuramyl pentapeptide phosphotransferase/UDP-N-acetylglucosamine-1-phosphate transferase
MKILGIVLIVAGVLVLAFGGFSYTREKKVVDLGPIQATTRTEHNVPIPPLAGGAAVLAGVAVLIVSTRKV